MVEQTAFPTNAKIIETKICNRIDELSKWKDSSVILAKGEIAFAIVHYDNSTSPAVDTRPEGHKGSYGVPTVMMKVGDGISTFKNLKWLAAPASDVYAWAKKSTIDEALDGSSTIEAFEAILKDIGEGQEYTTVLDAIAGEIEKFSSGYSDDYATGIITAIDVKSDAITVTRRQVDDSDIDNETISQGKIKDLTKFVSDTNQTLEKFDEMLSATGKVMEFIGTFAGNKTSLDKHTSQGYFAETADQVNADGVATAGHVLQKGDVVALVGTDNADSGKEYIYTITDETGSWEEFGHADATDAALEALKDRVDDFEAKVFNANQTTYTKDNTLQSQVDTNKKDIEELTKFGDHLIDTLNESVPFVMDVTENSTTNSYFTLYSNEETPSVETQYIIFNCGNASARIIDTVEESE